MSGSGDSQMAKSARVPVTTAQSTAIRSEGAVVVVATLVGALAVGALAVGTIAIGRLAIGRLALGRARLRSVQVDELLVARLTINELRVDAVAGRQQTLRLPHGAPSGHSPVKTRAR